MLKWRSVSLWQPLQLAVPDSRCHAQNFECTAVCATAAAHKMAQDVSATHQLLADTDMPSLAGTEIAPSCWGLPSCASTQALLSSRPLATGLVPCAPLGECACNFYLVCGLTLASSACCTDLVHWPHWLGSLCALEDVCATSSQSVAGHWQVLHAARISSTGYWLGSLCALCAYVCNIQPVCGWTLADSACCKDPVYWLPAWFLVRPLCTCVQLPASLWLDLGRLVLHAARIVSTGLVP